MTPKRKYLNEYIIAHRDIELTETAINILERVSQTKVVSGCIAKLKREQHGHLSRLDAAAAKLGTPHGA